MKMQSFFIITALSVTLLFIPKWKPEAEKAQINFSVKGPFGTVHGKFGGLKAEISFSEKDLAGSSVSASIEAKTISTGVGLRNKDLRNQEQWFNVDKYPLITFRSEKIEKKGSGYVAIGTLKLKDKSKTVQIPFSFSEKENTGVFKGKFVIQREDFTLGKKGGSVGKDVTIELNIPVKK